MEDKAEFIYRNIPEADKTYAKENAVHIEAGMWHAGELAHELKQQYPDSIMACYEAVSKLYPQWGKDAIRDRERVYRICHDHKDKYPHLLYSHWRAACDMHGEHGMDGVLEIASQIEMYSQAYEKRPSVDTVRSWVNEREGDSVFPVYWLRFQKGLEYLQAVLGDQKMPEYQRERVRYHLGELEKLEYGKTPVRD